MPTGYTAELCEKDQSFRDFLFTCARAFGACIALRDDPLIPELPDDVGFSPYHPKAKREAEARLARLEAMSETDRVAFGNSEIANRIHDAERGIAKAEELKDRLTKKLAEVEAWEPPTSQHQELKKFMRQQLESTIQFDGEATYYKKQLAEAKSARPLKVWRDAVDRAKADIEYHQVEAEKEAKRNEERNEWVRKLKTSA